jgi:hypothetical protein
MLEAKHVEVDFHFVRDTVNRISLISLSRFSFLGHKLTVDPLPLSLGGGGGIRELSLDNSSQVILFYFCN